MKAKTVVLGLVLMMVTAIPVRAEDQEVSGDTVLTLSEAYRTALDQNERIEAARMQRLIAGENVTQAESALYPQLSLRASTYREKEQSASGGITFPNEQTIWGADLNQPLYQGGQLLYGMNRAGYERKRIQHQVYRLKQDVLFGIAQNYYEVILAKKNVDLAENALERAESQLDRARARYEVGNVTRNAVLRAEVDVSEARQQEVEARNRREQALEALAVELGQSSVDQSLREPGTDNPEDRESESLVEQAYEHRRDIEQSKFALKAARENVKFERADYYPNVSLVGSYDNYKQEQFGTPEEDWRVTLQGSYPLFSGWEETSDVDEAQYSFRNARIDHRRLKREVRRDVRQAHSDVRTQKSVVRTLERQVQSSRENYREISTQFEEGLVDAVDVSDALTTLNEAEIRLASARNTLRLDRLRLKLATGTFAGPYLEKGSQP